jgi:hypothetical protein
MQKEPGFAVAASTITQQVRELGFNARLRRSPPTFCAATRSATGVPPTLLGPGVLERAEALELERSRRV